MRFDATVSRHYHFRCLICGGVEDVNIAAVDALEDEAAKACQAEICGHSLEFTGCCRSCRERKA
jgi:Fur family ferric uptake transcriptional regulator